MDLNYAHRFHRRLKPTAIEVQSPLKGAERLACSLSRFQSALKYSVAPRFIGGGKADELLGKKLIHKHIRVNYFFTIVLNPASIIGSS